MSLHYIFDDPPAIGDLQPVHTGIHWLRMPLPFALDHINLWVLEDGDGCALVDTGLASRDSEHIWTALLDGRLATRPVRKVVVTHFHPDHVGMAGWLTRRTGAPLYMTQKEWLWSRMLSMEHGAETVDALVEFSRQAGADEDYLDHAQRRGLGYHALVKSLPRAYQPLRHDSTLEIGAHRWRVIEGRGHAPEHACLYCDASRVLIAGDQVLPRISPIVGVPMWEPDSDPLADFLESIERLRKLPDDVLVLPSHGLPFRGLHARLDEMAAHHAERLQCALDACRRPITAWQAVDHLFRRELNHEHRGFALREAIAHLNYLMLRGRIRREADDAGVYRYLTSTAAG